MATKRNNRVSRTTLMEWYGCDIDFTITSKNESVRPFNGRANRAVTRDVITENYTGIEVRRDGHGCYVCQYRLSKTIAIRLAFGSSMQDAVAMGLGAIRRNGLTAKTLRAKSVEAAKKPAPATESAPKPVDYNAMIENAFQ